MLEIHGFSRRPQPKSPSIWLTGTANMIAVINRSSGKIDSSAWFPDSAKELGEGLPINSSRHRQQSLSSGTPQTRGA